MLRALPLETHDLVEEGSDYARVARWLVAAIASIALGVAWTACATFRASPLPGSTPDAGTDSGLSDADASPFTLTQALPNGEALLAIWGSDPNTIFAAGMDGLHTDYYDGAWHRNQDTLGRDYYCVWGTSATDVYAAGIISATNQGIIEHFDGSAWMDEYMAPTALYGIWGAGNLVLAVGSEGLVYGKDTGTTDWAARVTPGLPANPYVDAGPGAPILWGIAGSGPNDFAMPAGLDRLFHYIGNGDFVNLDPTVDRTIDYRSIWATPGTATSIFFGSNYFGVSWLTTEGAPDAALLGDNLYNISEDKSQPGNDQQFIWGIWGDATNTVFVGDQGRIYSYDAASNNFAPVASPVASSTSSTSLYGVWGSSITDIWIVGDRETILHGQLPQ